MKFISRFFGKLSDLQKRILFTLGALVIYRIGSFIPLPGVNASAVLHLFTGEGSGMMGMFDMFTGGSLSRMSVLALNIFPYISASIVLQLLTATSKSLNDLRKEGESGRIKINQYTRYLAVLLAVVQGWAVVRGLEVMAPVNGVRAVVNPGFSFELSAIIALVGGTVFVMWLAEQITARGIGQGASLLIFAGIIAQIPEGVAKIVSLGSVGQMSPAMIALVILFVVGIVALIAFFELAQRRVQILYPRQVMANGVVNTNASYLPIKVNMSGVMGPVFASSIMMLPAFVQRFVQSENLVVQNIMGFFTYGAWSYIILYTILIAFFAYFQTAVVFNSEETSNNLRNAGGYIPGVRPGEQTVSFLDSMVSRVTAIGVLYLIVVCVLPIILNTHFGMPLMIGGTSVLIVAGVVLDTMNQVQSYLVAKQYHGVMGAAKKGRFRN
ncbi:MAG: preprotein translocase subunit SecY [Alphaproteobacteria bacterium]|jgi:preprotein translocase subunit SecY|nr:preprotein translocase subunit SecY [Alphaproteobacteria bacterium]MBQ6027788.1 preprotein translocase subunit SecY [Alphaproteobacteria bacterium]